MHQISLWTVHVNMDTHTCSCFKKPSGVISSPVPLRGPPGLFEAILLCHQNHLNRHVFLCHSLSKPCIHTNRDEVNIQPGTRVPVYSSSVYDSVIDDMTPTGGLKIIQRSSKWYQNYKVSYPWCGTSFTLPSKRKATQDYTAECSFFLTASYYAYQCYQGLIRNKIL